MLERKAMEVGKALQGMGKETVRESSDHIGALAIVVGADVEGDQVAVLARS